MKKAAFILFLFIGMVSNAQPCKNRHYTTQQICNLWYNRYVPDTCGIDETFFNFWNKSDTLPSGGGNIPLPYIPIGDGNNRLIYSPGLSYDTAGILNGYPDFIVSGTNSDTSGSQLQVAWGNGDFLQYVNNQLYFNVNVKGTPIVSTGIDINPGEIGIGRANSSNSLVWYWDSLQFNGTKFNIGHVHYSWPAAPGTNKSVLQYNTGGVLSWAQNPNIADTGRTVLDGGTVNVSNSNITSHSLIFVQNYTATPVSTEGVLSVYPHSGGFNIRSNNSLDVSPVIYWIIKY